jgi:hypothetical protein
VGDSIVKGLQQHKLSKAAKQSVGVKFFPGATVGDMSDHIKPVLRRKPDTVILHVGTNNATNKEASEIVNDIDKLCQEVKKIDPNVEIILSELINREDNAKAKTTVQEVNRVFADYYTATNFNLIIHNNNIPSKSLNRSKLHLNNLLL